MTDRAVRDVRTMTDAEVFAALCALPEPFRFEVGRIRVMEPDPEAMHAATQMAAPPTPWAMKMAHEEAMRPTVFWTVMIASEPPHGNGAAFYGRAPTLAEAWLQVRKQIAAFREVL
jgi:hypothetical protein